MAAIGRTCPIPAWASRPGRTTWPSSRLGRALYGTLDVAGLDLVQASGAPTLSITGSSTQVTAASVGIGGGFTLDTGAYLQAGALGIDGGGTAVTVQNNATLYDEAGQNDVLTLGASAGNASLLVTRGGEVFYAEIAASGTLSVGGVSNSVASLTVSAGGYFASSLSSVNIGAVSGATGQLDVTGAGSQFIVDNYGYTTIGDYGELGGSAQGDRGGDRRRLRVPELRRRSRHRHKRRHGGDTGLRRQLRSPGGTVRRHRRKRHQHRRRDPGAGRRRVRHRHRRAARQRHHRGERRQLAVYRADPGRRRRHDGAGDRWRPSCTWPTPI